LVCGLSTTILIGFPFASCATFTCLTIIGALIGILMSLWVSKRVVYTPPRILTESMESMHTPWSLQTHSMESMHTPWSILTHSLERLKSLPGVTQDSMDLARSSHVRNNCAQQELNPLTVQKVMHWKQCNYPLHHEGIKIYVILFNKTHFWCLQRQLSRIQI